MITKDSGPYVTRTFVIMGMGFLPGGTRDQLMFEGRMSLRDASVRLPDRDG